MLRFMKRRKRRRLRWEIGERPIYWDPAVQIDSTGVVQAEFYMPDDPGSCRITIEGVTQEGYPIHYSDDINKPDSF